MYASITEYNHESKKSINKNLVGNELKYKDYKNFI